jgi:hypothetical protein
MRGTSKKPNKEKKQRRLPLRPDLYQMIGSQSPPFNSLKYRGFPEHYAFNSSSLRDRRKYLMMEMGKQSKVDSLNPDLLERGKVSRACL